MTSLDRQAILEHYREQLRLAQRDAAIREAERALADVLLNRDPGYNEWMAKPLPDPPF